MSFYSFIQQIQLRTYSLKQNMVALKRIKGSTESKVSMIFFLKRFVYLFGGRESRGRERILDQTSAEHGARQGGA